MNVYTTWSYLLKTPAERAALSMLAAILLTLGGCVLPVVDQPAVVVDPSTHQTVDTTPRLASPPAQRSTVQPTAVTPPRTATTAPPSGEPATLKPGQFTWHPERSPQGPVMVLVSLSDQRARIYRNGVLIGRTTISTGRPGHETPTGVFTILQKQVEHASTLYNSALMPCMERLTWDGIALHAGNLPGYPASHGCVRLPYEFSKKLYSVTASGTTVVISKAHLPPLTLSQPEALLAINAAATQPPPAAAKDDYFWQPQRSPTGPLTVLLSSADRAIYVHRNGVLIGRAPLQIRGPDTRLGNQVYKMLSGYANAPSPFVPSRPARRWMAVGMSGGQGQLTVPPIAGRVRIPPALAQAVYELFTPGTVLMISDQPTSRNTSTARNFVVMTSPHSAMVE